MGIAALGAFMVTALIYAIAFLGKGKITSERMVLSGMAISTLLASITTAIILQNGLSNQMIRYTNGSSANTIWKDVYIALLKKILNIKDFYRKMYKDENIDFDTKMKSLQSELQDLLVQEEKSKEELLGTASPRETRAELKKADTSDLFRDMYGGSTARKMEAIIEAASGLNAEGVLTIDEVEDFHDGMLKVLIRMKENARERFTPLSRRTDAQKLFRAR